VQEPTNNIAAQQPIISLSIRELAEVIVKHQDLHEGIYDLAFEFQIAVGAVGPQPDMVVPGAMIGVSRIGLLKAEQLGPHTVDAAAVNPIRKQRKPK
jgi:hypothetical protein